MNNAYKIFRTDKGGLHSLTTVRPLEYTPNHKTQPEDGSKLFVFNTLVNAEREGVYYPTNYGLQIWLVETEVLYACPKVPLLVDRMSDSVFNSFWGNFLEARHYKGPLWFTTQPGTLVTDWVIPLRREV